MSDIPPESYSAFLPPFSFTEVDHFGPLTIKLNKGTRCTSATTKRYDAPFSCMTIRAVHVELRVICQRIVLFWLFVVLKLEGSS